MNKWLVSMSAAAVAAGAVAVESANTVGVITTDVTADTYYMIGVPFESVGSNSGTISFDDLIKLDGIAAGDEDDDDLAEILVRHGNSYDKSYYYINSAWDEDDNEVGHDCWAIDGYECTIVDVQALGDGFWFRAPAASAGATITTKGQVATNAVKTVTFLGNGTYSIIANPFPTDICLANVTTSGVTAKDEDDDDLAEILVRHGNSYDKSYYYINSAWDEDDNEVGHDCWAIDGYIATGVSIEAGKSFWIRTFDQGNGSITFSL